jgi:hypothetical protein
LLAPRGTGCSGDVPKPRVSVTWRVSPSPVTRALGPQPRVRPAILPVHRPARDPGVPDGWPVGRGQGAVPATECQWGKCAPAGAASGATWGAQAWLYAMCWCPASGASAAPHPPPHTRPSRRRRCSFSTPFGWPLVWPARTVRPGSTSPSKRPWGTRWPAGPWCCWRPRRACSMPPWVRCVVALLSSGCGVGWGGGL